MDLTIEQLDNIWQQGSTSRTKMSESTLYYNGDHDINRREEADKTYADGNTKSNIVTNWIAYGIDMYVGALTSMPYQIVPNDDGDPGQAFSDYSEILDKNQVESVDVENLRNALINGYGVELIETEEGEIFISDQNPDEWHFVYDIAGDMKLAMRRATIPAYTWYTNRRGEERYLEKDLHIQTVYDSKEIVDYESETGTMAEVYRMDNPFGMIPVVRWTVNKDAAPFMGTDLKTQIDEYNDIDSTAGDDIRNHSNAKLVTKGFGASWIMDNKQLLDEYNILPLQDKDDDAYYVTRESGHERVHQRLQRTREHIHSMMRTPDIATIVGVTGGTSGIALRLKFQPMMQRAASMITFLKRGIRDRIEIINSIRGQLKIEVIERYNAVIEFTLPTNRYEEWQAIGSLKGIVSHRSMLSFLSDVDDPIEELKRIANEGGPNGTNGLDETDPEGVVNSVDQQTEKTAQELDIYIEAVIKGLADSVMDEVRRRNIIEKAEPVGAVAS